MSTHQNKDGRWFAKWYESGKEKRKYFGFGDLAARRAADYDRALKAEKQAVIDYGYSIGEILKAYHEQHLVEQSTGVSDYYRLSSIIIPRLGSFRAERLPTEVINRYVRQRLDEGKKRSTVARELAIIKAAFSWAENQTPAMLSVNTLARYRIPKSRDHDTPGPPTAREIETVIAHAEPHLLRALALIWYTGIRPGGEVERLRWTDYDEGQGTIRIVGVRKGGPAIRVVPVSDPLRQLLDQWKQEDENITGPIVHYREEAVLSLKKSWAAAKKAAGITRRLRLYDVRHAFATVALGSGADLKAISKIMGHRREDTTIRIYQHVLESSQRAAVSMVPPITILSLKKAEEP